MLAIRREEESFEPGGEERLRQGDRLSLLVPAASADELVDLIAAAGRSSR